MQVISGYLLAGSFIGPGGLGFVSEMVQVRHLPPAKEFFNGKINTDNLVLSFQPPVLNII